MTYEEWLETVPGEMTGDPLWQLKVYRLALFANALAWHDVTRLFQDRRTVSVSDQLYRSSGSVTANIAEGYSHRSGKDQARFYEYSLGSARETRTWYFESRDILPDAVVTHRLKLVTEIIRLLLTIIPSARDHRIAEESVPYDVNQTELLADPPMS